MENLRLYWEAGGGDFVRRQPRRGARGRRPRERRRPQGQDVLPGHAPAARRRPGPARSPGGARPRRADQRARPGRDPRDPRPAPARSPTAGVTVLLSSHLLSEVEQVCSHAVVMDRGQARRGGHGRRARPGGDVGVHRGRRRRRAARRSSARSPACAASPPSTRASPSSSTARERSDLVAALVNAGIAVDTVQSRHRLEDAFLGLLAEEERLMLACCSRTEMAKQWRRPRTYVALGLTVAVPIIIADRAEGEPAVGSGQRRDGGVLLPRDEDRALPPGRGAARHESLPARRRRRALRRRRGRVRSELGQPARAARPADRPRPAARRQARRRPRCFALLATVLVSRRGARRGRHRVRVARRRPVASSASRSRRPRT